MSCCPIPPDISLGDGWSRFIEDHPTIEDLQWHPLRYFNLAPGSLPAITRLDTTHDVAMSILLDPLPRPLSCLHGLVADWITAELLKSTVAGTVQSLSLASYEHLHSVSRLADTFPGLTSLWAPPFATTRKDYSYRTYPRVRDSLRFNKKIF